MSKYTLAVKLADELGTTVAKASKLIDDVGYTRAAKLLDEGAVVSDDLSLTSRVPDDWWKPVAVVGGVGGAGVVGYKYLDVRQAEALANEAKADADGALTIKDIMKQMAEDDTLTAAQKRELYLQLTGSLDGDKPAAKASPFEGATTILVLLVVLGVVFMALEDD